MLVKKKENEKFYIRFYSNISYKNGLIPFTDRLGKPKPTIPSNLVSRNIKPTLFDFIPAKFVASPN